MSGMIILVIGIGITIVGIILLVLSVIYRNTKVKRIKKELEEEYM